MRLASLTVPISGLLALASFQQPAAAAAADSERRVRRDRAHAERQQEPRPGLLDAPGAAPGGNPDCSATQVSAGSRTAFALATDGRVWAWGSNREYLLGRPNAGDSSSAPALHPGLREVAELASFATADFAVARHRDGTVSAWGTAQCGLGDGASFESAAPVTVAGLAGIVAIAVGDRHALALSGDGQIHAWGCNDLGQLGTGTGSPAPVPVVVSGPGTAIAIAAGADHSLAIASDGTVWAWGGNRRGQLGDGTLLDRARPVQTLGIAGARAIAAGSQFSLALADPGVVWSWGKNSSGQLGNGTRVNAEIARPVPGLSGIAGLAAGYQSALAVASNGTVSAWGDNFELLVGQIQVDDATEPAAVADLAGIERVAIGDRVALALRADGSIASWGAGAALGNGHRRELDAPLRMATAGFSRVDAGDYHALAIDAAGEVWGWGWNWSGMATTRALNRGISHPIPIAGFTGARDVAAGYEHSLLIDAAGGVWAWGSNYYGALGDGTLTDRIDPVAVPGLTTARKVVTSWESSYALLADGTVRAWGGNDYGQLGDGSYDASPNPVTVTGLDEVVALDSYEYHVVALRADGQVWSFGDNSEAVLGDAARGLQSAEPGPVPGLPAPVALAGGHAAAYARRGDGTLWAWGGNYWGQLGRRSSASLSFVPAPVLAIGDAVAVTAGEQHFLALGADGFISGAGYNVEGQLGDREISATHRPVAVDFDALPGDQGNRLMAIRDQGDVVLDFSLATASAWTLYRDLTGPAVGTTPHATPLTAPGHRDAGAAADSADYYYALRGLSPCTLTEGP